MRPYCVLFAFALLACSAEHSPGTEPALSPEPELDAGERDGEAEPHDAGHEPAERTHWVIYRGFDEPDATSASTEITFATVIGAQSAGAAATQHLPSSAGVWSQQWANEGAWLIERVGDNELLLWDMTDTEIAAPQRWVLDGDAEVSILPAPRSARFLVAETDVGENFGATTFSMLDATRSKLLPLPIEGARAPKWSPNRDVLLFEKRDGEPAELPKLVLFDPDDTEGEPLQLSPPSEYWDTTSWSPDGRWIAADANDPSAGHTIFLIDVDRVRADGPATPWRMQHDPDFEKTTDRILSWSPNSEWLLLLSSRNDIDYAPELQLIDMRGERPSAPIVPAHQPKLNLIHQDRTRWSPDGKRVVVIRALDSETPSATELFVFDVRQPEAGPLFQRKLAESTSEPFVEWTAEDSLVFHDDTTLFIHTLEDGAEPEVLADGVGADLVRLSPDGRKLIHPGGGLLHMITFGAEIEQSAITFERIVASSSLQWLPDSSGFVVLTAPSDGWCSDVGCRLEYVTLDASGQPRSPIAAGGHVRTMPDRFVLQP